MDIVNTCPSTQEMQLISLDQKDPSEEGKATHSSVLAWQATGPQGHTELNTAEVTACSMQGKNAQME